MPRATVDDVAIAYLDDAGASPPVVLLNGLGYRHDEWDVTFLRRLRDAGFRLITMAHRGAGTTALDHTRHPVPKPRLGALRRALDRGEAIEVPYRLSDMADDVRRLLDHLGVPAAHIVGVSMGGAIGQELAIAHPDRVLTLTSIMATTGDPLVGQPTPEAARALFRAPPADPARAIEDLLDARRAVATPSEFDDDTERARIRGDGQAPYQPVAAGNQLAAIWAGGDRTDRLRTIRVPTLVIHGGADPLIDVSGGRATAAAIPGARMLVVDGMGHDLPPSRWPVILQAMISHFDSIATPDIDPRIVPADPAHSAALAAIAGRAFAGDKQRYGSGPPGLDHATTHRNLIARCHGHELWTEGRLAGCVYVCAGDFRGDWWVGSILVEPRFQRRRFGRRLMEFVHAAHPAPHRFSLTTPYGNAHLHRFYESLGYQKVGATEPGSHPEASDPRFHLYRYQKTMPIGTGDETTSSSN